MKLLKLSKFHVTEVFMKKFHPDADNKFYQFTWFSSYRGSSYPSLTVSKILQKGSLNTSLPPEFLSPSHWTSFYFITSIYFAAESKNL